MSSSLRHFLADLRSRDKLLVVSREVDPEFELNAVVRKIQATRNLPVFFEKIRGSRFPVVSNTLGNYGIIAGLLGVDIGQVAARWSRLTGPSSAKVEKQFDAEKAEYEKIALSEIPHITYSEKDAGPYLTASVIIAQDPDSSITNLSFHRMQIVGPAELRCRLSTSGDLFRIQQKMEQRGLPLKAVVAIGLPPAVMLAAGTTVGPDNSEYDLAERIAGGRFSLRPSPLSKLPVPDSAEILIEGEILPNVRRPEGPFGEWMDYYVPVTDNHVFQVTGVFARKDAIFYAISAGSSEEIAMTAAPMAGNIYTNIRTWVSSVKDVTCFPLLQFCFVKIEKRSEGQAQKAMVAAFGAEMNRLMYCIVVDEDVDIHNPQDVLWAMATRCRPDQMTFTIPNIPSFARDLHQVHWGRLGIDATKPLKHLADFERKKVPGFDDMDLGKYLR